MFKNIIIFNSESSVESIPKKITHIKIGSSASEESERESYL
jgi:hypothetical protein